MQYGKNIEADRPFYGSDEVKGDMVIVKINDAAQQLVLKCAGDKVVLNPLMLPGNFS